MTFIGGTLTLFSCSFISPPTKLSSEKNNFVFLFLFWQAGYIRIDGSVPSSERIQLVHKFQSDPETRVAVLSIQAAGQVLLSKLT